jgi:hypothetical protein
MEHQVGVRSCQRWTHHPPALSATAGDHEGEVDLAGTGYMGPQYLIEKSAHPPTATSWGHAGVATKSRASINGLTREPGIGSAWPDDRAKRTKRLERSGHSHCSRNQTQDCGRKGFRPCDYTPQGGNRKIASLTQFLFPISLFAKLAIGAI